MSKIKVDSIGSLEELEICIARFAVETKDAIEAIERQIEQKAERLDQIVAERRRVVSDLLADSESTDDEQDRRAIQKQLEAAEEELREAKNWQRRVQETCAAHQKNLKRVDYLAGKHTDRGRTFLKAQVAQLYEYVEFKPSRAASNGGALFQTAPALSLTRMGLPAGFGWISLDDLNPDDTKGLSAESDYRKGFSESDMKEGLRLLRDRVLPEIQRDPSAATIWHFTELDNAEQRSGVNSLADIFAAYFGDSQIKVSRYQGQRYFNIGNGRHRIKAARDLGWDAVPGRIVEVPPPTVST
jgi:hypothetical protein